MIPATVVYDACVLFPAALRDLLLRLAVAGLCRARWSEDILDEVFRALRSARPDLDPERLDITRQRMCDAVQDCLVRRSRRLAMTLELPDPGDRHVLATAIICNAEAIVTYNVKDFPAAELDLHDIRALHPDEFLVELVELAPKRVVELVQRQAAALANPPCSVESLLMKLRRQGLARFATRLEQWL